MRLYELLLGILAVWRVTHLLNAEVGPWEVLARLRRTTTGFGRELLGCFYCLSLWISAPLALWLRTGWGERFLLWLALSAGAVLLERLTSARPVAMPSYYVEDQEDQHVWLPGETTDDSAEPASATPEWTGHKREAGHNHSGGRAASSF